MTSSSGVKMWRSGVDYHTLITKAVRSLDESTDKARRALYERARAAQMKELRAVHPPLSESAIAKERLTLEGAIRKVETDTLREAERRSREMGPKPLSPSTARLKQDTNEPKDRSVASEETAVSRSTVTPTELWSGWLIAKWARGFSAIVQSWATKNRSDKTNRSTATQIDPPPLGDHSLSETETVSSNENPSAVDEFGQIQEASEPFRGYDRHPPLSRSYRNIVGLLVTLLILAGCAATISWQWPRLSGLYSHVAQLVVKQQDKSMMPQSASASKSSDRVHPERNVDSASATRDSQTLPTEAQRVVLYEEDSSDSQGKRYFGLVMWRTEITPTGPGSASDVAVRADIKIPERLMTMTWFLRRNVNPALAASHTVAMTFGLPADFAGGGIASMPGILMKQSEEMPGKPLAKLAVKAINDVFTIELSAADAQRNAQLLRESSWLDIPIVYVNGTRAIMAVEKGAAGDRAFAEAFAAWDQN